MHRHYDRHVNFKIASKCRMSVTMNISDEKNDFATVYACISGITQYILFSLF